MKSNALTNYPVTLKCKLTGVPYETARSRIKKGMDPVEACTRKATTIIDWSNRDKVREYRRLQKRRLRNKKDEQSQEVVEDG